MKNVLFTIPAILIIAYSFTSCGENTSDTAIVNQITKDNEDNANISTSISDNEAYAHGTIVKNLSQENLLFLMKEFGLKKDQVKKCFCDDDDMVLFPMPLAILNPSIGKVRTPRVRPNGESNYMINLRENKDGSYHKHYKPMSDKVSAFYAPKIVTSNKKLPVVAILDSGLDIHQFNTSSVNLMDITDFNSAICADQSSESHIYGWNFVNNTSNIDDTSSFHGTDVTNTFLKTLDFPKTNNIEKFQLLTLKLFGESGEASYWDIICAFKYLKRLETEGYNIAIVNSSFGFDFDVNTDSLSNLYYLKEGIDNLKKTVVVASAGNRRKDLNTEKVFPACYNHVNTIFNPDDTDATKLPVSTNLISVAGHDGKDTPKIFEENSESGSNYGDQTVDIAAKWAYTVQGSIDGQPQDIEVKGTSFSAPQVAAKLFDYYIENNASLYGKDLKNNFLDDKDVVKKSTTLNVIDGKYIE